jgi:hypothetical protein
MASKVFVLNFNDVTKVDLELTFSTFKKTSTDISVAAPTITELGVGFYKFGFDMDTVDSDLYYVATDGDSNVLTGVLAQNNNDTLAGLIQRLLGLCYENQTIDETDYDGNGNLLSCRLRIYSDAASVGSDDDVVATYNMVSTYSGNFLTDFNVVKA